LPDRLLYHIVLVAVVCLAVLLLGAVVPERRAPSILRSAALFMTACAALILAWAWPSFLVGLQFDPDESLLIAEAHRATSHPIPWRDFDGGTSGPVNVFAIDAMHALGFSFSYTSARLLAVVLAIISVIAAYRAIALLYGEFAGRVTAVLAALFYAFATFESMSYYSTESLSVALLAVAALAIVHVAKSTHRPPWLSVFTVGLLMGAIAFSKLQALPMAAVLALILLTVFWRSRWSRRTVIQLLAVFALSSLLVPIAVLLPVALSGSLHAFATSYIVEPLAYASGTRPAWFASGNIDVRSHPGFLLVAVISAILICVALVLATVMRRRESPPIPIDTEAVPLVCLTALVVVAGYVTIKPHLPFGHYLLFVALPICAAAGAFIGYMLERSNRADLGRFAALASIALLATTGTAVELTLEPATKWSMLMHDLAQQPACGTKTTFSLLREIPAGSSVASWGWFPEMYVIAPIAMGTRATDTAFGMWPGPFQSYLLHLYITDLEDNKPAYFLDAVTDKPQPRPSLTVPRNRHEYYPVVAHYIRAHYRLIDQADGMRLYARDGGSKITAPPHVQCR
jgi:hypothetical protein